MDRTPMRRWALGLMGLALLALTTGCTMRVAQHPPAHKHAHVTHKKPHPHAVWVKGHYAYIDGKYHWVPGHWKHPRAGR